VSKSNLDNFTKSQRAKGDSAKCKDCTNAPNKGAKDQTQEERTHAADIKKKLQDERKRQKDEQAEKQKKRREERKRQRDEAAEKLHVENKLMEGLEERACTRCKVVKKRDTFDDAQQKKGNMSVCKDCIEEKRAKALGERKRLEEERKRREAVIRQDSLAVYERCESDHYKKKKDLYADHVKMLKKNGFDIEQEMATPSDLVYVVTSIHRYGDQFSPHLYGIYTTCRKAQEGARKSFERLSTSYRDGKFLPNVERIAKCDVTTFLIPGVEFTSRPMFEVFGEYDEDEHIAVAINAVRIDSNVRKDLPFLQFWRHECTTDLKIEEGNNAKVASFDEDTKVYAIFNYWPGNMGMNDSVEVQLCGVFRNREDAIERAKFFTSFNDDEVEKEQLEDAQGKLNGKLFHDMDDDCWVVALETVTLDKQHHGEYGRELDVGIHGDSCWMSPEMEFY